MAKAEQAKQYKDLHVGWKLKKTLVLEDELEEVMLSSRGMAAHMAVIAQSGSGKSFMVGRLLEELASKTRARIVILDPNSDFGKFGSIATHPPGGLNADEDQRYKDAQKEFEQLWGDVRFGSFTHRASSIILSWPDVPVTSKANYLGVSLEMHPDEWLVFSKLTQDGRHLPKGKKYTLKEWQDRIDAMIQVQREARPYENKWPYSGLVSNPQLVVMQLAPMTLQRKLRQLSASGLWDGQKVQSVQQMMADLWKPDSDNPLRLLSLDLGSIGEVDHRFITAGVALEALWNNAQAAWEQALQEQEPTKDNRCPVFVVLDEAHNLAGEGAEGQAARSVLETLVRIAMEGRKYGLFLVLITQRPARVNSHLLSQCDNVCLMKMSNPADVSMMVDRFGFLDKESAEKSLDFTRGQALFAGQFVKERVFAKIAPRRTAEGGRSLLDAAWLLPK